MKYYFAGSNLFGQWYGCQDAIIEEFSTFPVKSTSHFDIKESTLIHIGWSHNIYEYKHEFYIVGDVRGLEGRVIVASLPEECINCLNLVMVSDDHHFILVNMDTCTFWTFNLENKQDVKKVKINVEIPEEKDSKRQRRDDFILNCEIADGMLLFLTNEGLVYSGLLPSLVDSRHCLGKVIDVKCGNEHSMLLTDAGRVYTWGNGRRLQLGHGDVTIIETPTEVEALAGIKITQIAAGGWHSLALSEFGDLYAWGWNDTGQLGIKEDFNKDSKSYSLPTLVDLYDEDGNEVKQNIKTVACGSRHSAILLEDYCVWTTGNNKYGQCGFKPETNPVVQYFKKAFMVRYSTKLMCGQWSTAVVIWDGITQVPITHQS